MNPRVAIALVTVVLGVAVVVVAVGLAGGDGSGAALPRSGFAGPAMPPHVKARDFTLSDQDGRSVRLSSFRGSPVVLTFLYTTCRDTCPATAGVIRQGLDQLGRDVPALAVSVDPRGDTAFHARRFLLKQHVSGRMRFLLGSRRQLAPIWNAYGVRGQSKQLEHTAFTFLVDKRGLLRVGYGFSQLSTSFLAHDLGLLLRERV